MTSTETDGRDGTPENQPPTERQGAAEPAVTASAILAPEPAPIAAPEIDDHVPPQGAEAGPSTAAAAPKTAQAALPLSDEIERRKVKEIQTKLSDNLKLLFDRLENIPLNLLPSTYAFITEKMQGLKAQADLVTADLTGSSLQSLQPIIQDLSDALETIVDTDSDLPPYLKSSMDNVLEGLDLLLKKLNSIPPFPADELTTAWDAIENAQKEFRNLLDQQLPQDVKSKPTVSFRHLTTQKMIHAYPVDTYTH